MNRTKNHYRKESKIYDKKRFETPIGKYIDRTEKQMILYNLKPPSPSVLCCGIMVLDDLNLSSVLELCCGTGRFADYLSEKGVDYTGIDFSKEMLNIAKKKNKNKNIHLKLMDIKNINKLKNKFDNIFVARAIKFWQNPQQVINNCHTLLKNKGRLILCFQAKDKSFSGLLMRISQKSQDRFTFLRSYKVRTEHYYYSNQIEEMLKKANFKIINKKRYFNFFAYFQLMKINKNLQKLFVNFFNRFDNKFNYGWRTVIVGQKKQGE